MCALIGEDFVLNSCVSARDRKYFTGPIMNTSLAAARRIAGIVGDANILANIGGFAVSGEDPLVPETDSKIENGHVRPLSGPGLGVTVDEKALEKFTLYREEIK
jgi:L-alanine-DL-glutamate epimerase-like enolase superfamily enzyme